MANNAELIDNLIEKASALISDNGLKDGAKQNLRALLQSAFGKLDMVSRDEFDAQTAVLARTRSKIEVLEKQLEELLAATKQA